MSRVISKAKPLAFVQNKTYGKWHLSESCRGVALALTWLGYDVRAFTQTKLPPLHRITPQTPVKGSTGCLRDVFQRVFRCQFPNIDVPGPLTKYARRKIRATTLGEVRARYAAKPDVWGEKFMKPLLHAKVFDGQTVSHALHWGTLQEFPDALPVAVHDHRHFVEEDRFFILKDDIIPAYHSHSPKLLKFASKLSRLWGENGAPKAYAMDVGFSKKPGCVKTVPTLVEVNSVLTTGNMSDLTIPTGGKLVVAAWESYTRYAERGKWGR